MISKILANALLAYAVFPAVFGSLYSQKKGVLSLNVSLFVIYKIFCCITYKPFLEAVALGIFSKTLKSEIVQRYIMSPHPVPQSYTFTWKIKNFWDFYEPILREHINYLYREHEKEGKAEVTDDVADERFYSPKNTSKVDETQFYSPNSSRIEEAKATGAPDSQPQSTTLPKLPNDQRLITELKRISHAVGVVTLPDVPGLEFELPAAPMTLFFSSQGNQATEVNVIRDLLLSFLRSKEDCLLLLTISVLTSMISNTNLNPETLASFDLFPPMRKDSQALFQQIFLNLLCVDPPFRVATMLQISKLYYLYCQGNEPVDGCILQPAQVNTFNQV